MFMFSFELEKNGHRWELSLPIWTSAGQSPGRRVRPRERVDVGDQEISYKAPHMLCATPRYPARPFPLTLTSSHPLLDLDLNDDEPLQLHVRHPRLQGHRRFPDRCLHRGKVPGGIVQILHRVRMPSRTFLLRLLIFFLLRSVINPSTLHLPHTSSSLY